MKAATLLVGWCVLLVLSWPIALAVLVWFLAQPFRLLGLLPVRLLGHRS